MKNKQFKTDDIKKIIKFVSKNNLEDTLSQILITEYFRLDNPDIKIQSLLKNISNNNINFKDIFQVSLEVVKNNNEFLKNIINEMETNITQNELSELIELFKPIKEQLSSKENIGNLFSLFIDLLATTSKKKYSQLITPKKINYLLSLLITKDNDIESIYDPTVGTGNLLIEVAKNYENANIYGQDINESVFKIAQLNLYINNMNVSKLKRSDVFSNPILDEDNSLKKFDVIVSNPPFSLRNWFKEISNKRNINDPYNIFKDYSKPPKSRGDYAFVLHMIKSLKENGQMAVVLPYGVLFRSRREGEIRKKLIENNLIDAVIGLPEGLFYDTSIPVTILIFKKNRKKKDILFINANNEENILDENLIKKIAKTYKNYETADKFSNIASLEEIKKHNYNLNIARYIDIFDSDIDIDLEKVSNEIIETKDKLNLLNDKIEKIISN